MKTYSILLIVASLLILSLNRVTAQNEDPAKLLSMKKLEQIDKYLKTLTWKEEKPPFKDETDGDYFLYRKKASGGGSVYLAVYPQKMLHYFVFFEESKKYSKVLSYEELLHMPEGKGRFSHSQENKLFSIKSITLDDPNETRNQNIYYAKTSPSGGAYIDKSDDIKDGKTQQQKEKLDEMQQDELLNEEEISNEKDKVKSKNKGKEKITKKPKK